MSTKIYNAYWFEGVIEELMEHLMMYRKKWIEYQTDRIANVAKEKNIKTYYSIRKKIHEETLKQMPTWDDEFDVRGEVAVYFHNGYIYIQEFLSGIDRPLFVDNRFHDWHYQNQTDPWYESASLDSESFDFYKKEWLERKKMWDDIFHDRISNATQAGLIYSFVSLFEIDMIAMNVSKK